MKRCAFLLLALGRAFSVPPASDSGTDPALALRARLDRAVAEKQIPGAVVVVMHQDALVFEEAVGWADIEGRRRMRVQDDFFLASSTKPLSATAIVALVQDGRLSLDDSAAKWFPSLALDGVSPTIRQLLSHQAGILWTAIGQPPSLSRKTLAQLADEIARVPLAYTPGSKCEYGGGSFILAGRIAEIVSGKDFESLLKEKVLDPLGMTLTFFRVKAGAPFPRYAVAYRRTPTGLERLPVQPRAPAAGGLVLVSGGLTSRAADLVPFLQMHRRMGRFAGESRLSSKLALEMRRDQTAGKWRSAARGDTGSGYGLGWQLEESNDAGVANVFYHAGAFGTILWCDARAKLDVVFLTQMPLKDVLPLWNEILKQIRASWKPDM